MAVFTVFSLLGGVGLFLFGMTIMSTGLKNACGSNLQTILEKATKNRFLAILVGIGTTMLIQSSSATDVMVIGFVNSGIMKLSQAIGIIMGANIGTTITAQITAFNLSNYTPLILFVGVVLYIFIKQSLVKHIGAIVMGFGMLFQGIIMMKAAITPLSESPDFIHFMGRVSTPAIAFLFGVGFTALVQSSSSSIVIFQAFAMEGLFTYDIAVYLVIGAAIGSVTPNLLAAITANRNGKRSAILNLIFNLIRALILIIIINVLPQTLELIKSLSPHDIGRQIANTHTIFAIAAVLIEAPFANKIVDLAKKIIPVREEEKKMHSDRSLQFMEVIGTMPPAVALHQSQMEIARMGRIACGNLKLALNAFFSMDADKIEEVKDQEETVDILNQKIAAGMVELRSLSLGPADLQRISLMTIAITDIERISDHAENIAEYIDLLKAKKAKLSDVAIDSLKDMAAAMLDVIRLSIDIFESENYRRLDEVDRIEDRVDHFEESLIAAHVDRLMDTSCDPVAGVVFTDLVTDMERCADHAVNIAYSLKQKRKF